ncbi:MCE family protein, partial [candidate division KSB3 bacterium]|nr:MCE family protein [candidate division KSB3 bacterium]MBD3326906.1 MCE family protein [candidate division KSB3 bacterium]
MKYSANEIKVGFVVILSFTFLVGFIVVLTGSGLWEETVSYKTQFRMSAGLQAGDVVRYGGYKVGKLTDVHISKEDPTKIKVAFSVNTKTPVKEDSFVFINYIGLLGDYYIEIAAGSEDAPRLEPGSEIPSKELMQFSDVIYRVDSISGIVEHLFTVIDEKVSLILTDANQVLSNVNQLIGDVNQQKVRSILNNVDTIVETNAETLGGILENLRSMLAQVDALSKSLNAVVVENEAEIQEAMRLLQSLMASGEETVGSLNSILGDRRDELEGVVTNVASISEYLAGITAEIHQNKAHINAMLENLDTLSANLAVFSQFADDNTGKDVQLILDNIRASSENLTLILQRVQANNEEFEQLLTNLTTSSGNVSELTTFLVEQQPELDATLGHVQNATRHIDQVVTAIDQEKIATMVETVEHIITTNTDTISTILQRLEQTTRNVGDLSQSLNTVVVEHEDELTEVFRLLHATVQSGEQTVQHLQNLLVGNTDNIQTVVQNTTDLSTYLAELAAQLHQNKARIQNMLTNLTSISAHVDSLAQFADTEAKDDVQQTLANIQTVSDQVKTMLTRVQDNTEQFEQLLTNLTASSGDVSALTAFLSEQRPQMADMLTSIHTTSQ